VNGPLLYIVAVIGAGTLVGVFLRMKPGFGSFNLRVVGIVLVATLSSILALTSGEALTAAMGILGAIVGYLIGRMDHVE
jgi:hypothetical protein